MIDLDLSPGVTSQQKSNRVVVIDYRSQRLQNLWANGIQTLRNWWCVSQHLFVAWVSATTAKNVRRARSRPPATRVDSSHTRTQHKPDPMDMVLSRSSQSMIFFTEAGLVPMSVWSLIELGASYPILTKKLTSVDVLGTGPEKHPLVDNPLVQTVLLRVIEY